MAIGSFSSFLVGIISPMILSRFFDKGDYGTYKQVMYVYNTLLAIFTLGLPKSYSYFLPKYTKEYSKDIIHKITRIFFILGASFSLFLFLCARPIASLLNNADLELALRIFSPTPFFLLPTLGLDAIYSSFKKTKYLAYYTIFTRTFTVICIILPVLLFKGNYLHAIIGFDIASLITFFLAIYLKSWPVKNEPRKTSSLTYKQIFNFSIPLLFASLWGTIIASANQFFISRYYGNEAFAEFSNGFMELPFVGMIISAIAAILMPVFSGMDKGEGFSTSAFAVWNSALIKSAKIIFPMLIYSIFFAGIIMRCMYGELYANSSIYFQIKNISGLLYIIPFAPIILAIGKTREYARVHLLIALLIVAADFLVVISLDSAIWVAIVSELCQALKIFLLMKVIADYAHKTMIEMLPMRDLVKVLLVSLLSGVLSFSVLSLFDANKFVLLGVSFVLFIILFYSICWVLKLSYKDVVCGFVRKEKTENLLRFVP